MLENRQVLQTEMPSADNYHQMWKYLGGFNLTPFLAVWGAILSSITLGWTLYRDLRDRAKVKVSARLRIMGRRAGDGALYVADPKLNIEGAGDQLFIVVSVVNIGRRRFRWKALGGTYRTSVNGRKSFLVSTRNLPKVLEEQEALDEIADLNADIARGNIKSLKIWDGSGNEWKVPSSDMRRLHADLRKHVDLSVLERANADPPGDL